MRGAEECLTAGGPWSLEEIENVTGYVSMKEWQLGKNQAEIEQLKAEMGPLYPEIEDLNGQCNKYDSEIEQLNAELDYSADYPNKQQAEIESLNSRLKVLQNYHKEGPENFDMAALYAALWDKEQVEL